MNLDPFLQTYVTPGVFTELGRYRDELDTLRDAGAIARAVQGMLVHESMAGAYGLTIGPERAGDRGLYTARAMLARAKKIEGKLGDGRSSKARLAVVCRHFASLFAAIARANGVPARVRCGFANYFEPGKHVDHWVAEIWSAPEQAWRLIDAQVDEHQKRYFNIGFDTLDVPRDRFLVAGDAWRKCRAGDDAKNYGVAGTEMWGLTEVYGNVFQDLAALQNIELLPWAWYGLAEQDADAMTELALVDRLAAISARADEAAMAELADLQAADVRLRVPPARIAKVLADENAA